MEQLKVVSGRTLLKIAKIKNSSGIKGDIKIVPLFFSNHELKGLLVSCSQDVYLASGNDFPKKINVIDVEEHHDSLIVKVDGFDSKTVTDAFKGFDVYVERTRYMEYILSIKSIFRLVGYQVVDDKLGLVGTVVDVIKGKQDLLSLDDKHEKLIPFVNELIKKVDDGNKSILTKLPDGIF